MPRIDINEMVRAHLVNWLWDGYGLDANRILEYDWDRYGYDEVECLPDGQSKLDGDGYPHRIRREWPEGFDYERFLELLNRVYRY